MLHSWGIMMFLYFATLKGHLTGGGQKYHQKWSISDETRFCCMLALAVLSCMHTNLHACGLSQLSFD